jgi:hypothetical protein
MRVNSEELLSVSTGETEFRSDMFQDDVRWRVLKRWLITGDKD